MASNYSMFEKKENISKKVSENFPGQIKTLNQLLLKHHQKNHQVKNIYSYFSPYSSSESISDKTANHKNISHN